MHQFRYFCTMLNHTGSIFKMTKTFYVEKNSPLRMVGAVLLENQFLPILISVHMPARPSHPNWGPLWRWPIHPPSQSKCYAYNRQIIRRNPYWQLLVRTDSNTNQQHLDGWEIILVVAGSFIHLEREQRTTWKPPHWIQRHHCLARFCPKPP